VDRPPAAVTGDVDIEATRHQTGNFGLTGAQTHGGKTQIRP
jgi:hypothetical protein